MAYIGPGLEHQFFEDATTQTLIPDSAKTVWDLNVDVPTSSSIRVVYGGVVQQPDVAYTTTNQQITFTFTPQTGITLYVVFLTNKTPVGVPGDDTITPEKLSGSSLDLFVGNNVLTSYKNLKASRTSNTVVNVTADELLLTSANNKITVKTINENITITTSGVSGLDTGSETSSTWYHLWIIYNGTTVNGLMSLSSTAPTMPSGYTYKGYVGAVYNNSSSNLHNFSQVGNVVGIPIITLLSNGTATGYTAVATTVPTTASKISLQSNLESTTTTGLAKRTYIASTSGGLGETWLESFVFSSANNRNEDAGSCEVPHLVNQTIYYKVVSSCRQNIWINGWTF